MLITYKFFHSLGKSVFKKLLHVHMAQIFSSKYTQERSCWTMECVHLWLSEIMLNYFAKCLHLFIFHSVVWKSSCYVIFLATSNIISTFNFAHLFHVNYLFWTPSLSLGFSKFRVPQKAFANNPHHLHFISPPLSLYPFLPFQQQRTTL